MPSSKPRRSAPGCGTLGRRVCAGCSGPSRVVGLGAVGAPVALDLAAVHVDDGDALVEVAVSHVGLVGLGSMKIWRRGRSCSCRGCCVEGGLLGRRRRIPRALLAELRHELAVARELQDVRVGAAVAANPDEAFVVDDDAVVGIRPIVAAGRSVPPQWPTRLPAGSNSSTGGAGMQHSPSPRGARLDDGQLRAIEVTGSRCRDG